ncbi:hypothetical protein PFICI_11953 [Pestalotiopsis fici W106-1]|uniref:Major facilitator superfamily (MFS) profile domain-containing protein n=1 Tax=Pestalotiopsis fici (strain W106-1 / CGMCC3.15140) TaxID=1229662 RepID=W3WUM3_PESFW|nr:uncharacterized protein PFICI_11953 [Pestalotiopsis fici W106-1]ETS76566.1 hypothetical protein PFICI_11953 [Pestalotiopsis fici W106-1]
MHQQLEIRSLALQDCEAISASDNPQGQEQNPYNRFSNKRKLVIVVVTSFCGVLAPFSSIGILSATPELSDYYETTDSIINISNALYMVFMGISAPIWAPISQIYGRRPVMLLSGVLFSAFSTATIFAPNLPVYFVLRMLVALHGTPFLVVGTAIIGDIYTSLERANALSWFLFGGLFGPAIGPLVGGIIVTYRPWQYIFVLQAALSGFALVLASLLIPETIHKLGDADLYGLGFVQKATQLWRRANPFRSLYLLSRPNLAMVAFASGSIMWSMYALLTPIRQVLNPRYNLTSPVESALFYLAPGCGYLVGASMGGRYCDWSLQNVMHARKENCTPEDRLRCSLVPLGIITPACILIYGWTVQEAVGGISVTVITMFVQGVAQLFILPALNSYCLDVMPERGAETIAVNYITRYIFAAGGTASAIPIIQSIGLGATTTIAAGFLILAAIGIAVTISRGKYWRSKAMGG